MQRDYSQIVSTCNQHLYICEIDGCPQVVSNVGQKAWIGSDHIDSPAADDGLPLLPDKCWTDIRDNDWFVELCGKFCNGGTGRACRHQQMCALNGGRNSAGGLQLIRKYAGRPQAVIDPQFPAQALNLIHRS